MSEDRAKYNSSGCVDTTAFDAINHVAKEEYDQDRKVHDLINALKFITDSSGFEFIGRVWIRHRKSGKEYR